MAYNGYLIKVLGIEGSQTASSDYIIPMHFIVEKSYKMTLSTLDFDSTRTSAGDLVRNALKNKKPHCTVHIKPLNNTQLGELFSNISARYTVKKENKVKCSVFIPELNDYQTIDMYKPDTDLTITRIENNTTVFYEGFELEFICY